MKYYLFLDESGDHGLSQIDPNFTVFVLCGILISEENYVVLRDSINRIKHQFWNDKKVIFHSRDIRKCEKEFQIFFDLEIKRRFYNEINALLVESNYSIITSAIQKDEYILRYGRLSNDVYEIALSFIIERTIFCLDDISGQKTLDIIIERRGKKEDKQLEEHFQKLHARGTAFVKPERLKTYQMSISFKNKSENINGLQIADLIAYPIARYCLDKEQANPAFDIIAPKIYSKGNKRYGLKIFP